MKEWRSKDQNKILNWVVFFHVLTIIWRVITYFHYGRPDEEVAGKWYMIWKSSAVGDLGNTLSAACVYMQYFRKRYLKLKTNETLSVEDRKKVSVDQNEQGSKFSYYAIMWIAILGYSTYWGVFLYMALEAKTLGRLDEIMTATIACFGVVIGYQSAGLYSQIKLVMEPHQQFGRVQTLLKSFLIALTASVLF